MSGEWRVTPWGSSPGSVLCAALQDISSAVRALSLFIRRALRGMSGYALARRRSLRYFSAAVADVCSMPLTSDRWMADPFPVPRVYDVPLPAVSPLASLVGGSRDAAMATPGMSSTQSSPPRSPTSTNAPSSPFSPVPRADNRPFHLSAAPHPRWFTSHLHQLERDVSHSRSRLAEVEAEETYHFPDASEATHSKPLIPNQIKGFCIPGADTAEVKVCGDLAALGVGAGVAVWSASGDLASCASVVTFLTRATSG